MNKIDAFFGEYRWLSNFHVCDIPFNGYNFTSTEAAYQSCKNIIWQPKFPPLTPKESKALGKRVPLRADWDDVKDTVMYHVNLIKYNDHYDLRKKLIATGDAELIEGNTWGDQYWGVCNGVGKNMLGKILMQIRDHFQKLESEYQSMFEVDYEVRSN